MAEPAPSFEDFMSDDIEKVETPPVDTPPVDTPPTDTPPVVDEPAAPSIIDKVNDLLNPPEPKPDDKPADTPPADDPEDKPPGNATPQAQQKWIELRKEAKRAKQIDAELTSVKAELETLRKEPQSSDTDASIKQLQKERDDLLQEVRIARVEGTPEFKDNIAKPMGDILEQARAIAKKHEIPERDVLTALTEADADKQGDLLAAVTENLNDREKQRLFNMADRYSDLENKAKYLRDNAHIALETLEKSHRERITQAQAAHEKEWTSALDTVSKEFSDTLFLLRPIEGEEEWNKGIQEVHALAKSTRLERLDPSMRAKALYQALLIPRALEFTKKQAETIAALRRQLGTMRKAKPGAGGGSPSPSTEAVNPDLGFVEAIG
jgi:hypothetical protein